MTLSNNLLAVLEANTSSSSARQIDGVSVYENAILANAAALDDIYAQSTTDGVSTIVRASLACEAASLVLGNSTTITPKSSDYSTEEQGNWSSDCWLPAKCFVKAQNTLEVALTLRLVTTLQATFAVRGAGHNANPGFSSIGQDGLLLDMGDINQITLNEDKSIVSVGAATTWDAVYGALEDFNLTAAGGRAAGIGVAGFLLGGGMSHLSNLWGLACDNVLNFEIVLADSSIVQANPKENAKLFKALKGGGPNFGIVTKIDLKTFPGSQLWFQVVVFNVSDKAAVMEAAVEVQKNMLQDNRIGLFLSDSPGALTAGMVYKGSAKPTSAFQPFDHLTPLMVAIPPTNGTFQSCAIALAVGKGSFWQIGGLTVAMDPNLYTELHDILAAFTNNTSISLGFTFQPFSAEGVAQGVAKGGNVLNITAENQAWLAFAISWTDVALRNTAISQTTQLMSAVSNAAAAKGQLLKFEFMNDASSLQSPLKGYGTASLNFLKSVSAHYDPLGVFQKLQNSGFLLSKV